MRIRHPLAGAARGRVLDRRAGRRRRREVALAVEVDCAAQSAGPEPALPVQPVRARRSGAAADAGLRRARTKRVARAPRSGPRAGAARVFARRGVRAAAASRQARLDSDQRGLAGLGRRLPGCRSLSRLAAASRAADPGKCERGQHACDGSSWEMSASSRPPMPPSTYRRRLGESLMRDHARRTTASSAVQSLARDIAFPAISMPPRRTGRCSRLPLLVNQSVARVRACRT